MVDQYNAWSISVVMWPCTDIDNACVMQSFCKYVCGVWHIPGTHAYVDLHCIAFCTMLRQHHTRSMAIFCQLHNWFHVQYTLYKYDVSHTSAAF